MLEIFNSRFSLRGIVMNTIKHPYEANGSWQRHLLVTSANDDSTVSFNEETVQTETSTVRQRRLKHHHHHHHHDDNNEIKYSAEDYALEQEKENEFWQLFRQKQDAFEHHQQKKLEKHKKRMQELYANPGINAKTVHSIMIDAGSTGSRLHLFEWEPRILKDEDDIKSAVAGDKLTFPGTESRWTDRLKPGLSSFATIVDDNELRQAISDYLQPLLDFAKAVLHAKADEFDQYPIYLRATAGMRILDPSDRSRVMDCVRSLFSTPSFNPFYFIDEQARVISGEEEAIFDWTGVNFLTGVLLHDSRGTGTVSNPRRTHGALDLGGASTQISFFEPNQDIMENLFKLQIGQSKHWNVYAHSFLYYGINEALDRFESRLSSHLSPEERLIDGIYNPCLPGGSSMNVRTTSHLDKNNVRTLDFSEDVPLGNGLATLLNNNERGDFDHCMDLVKDLLHLEQNDWCNFAYKGDCSLGGIYQPKIPSDVEFVGFSNYYDVWNFLNLPERATIQQLKDSTSTVCSMTMNELFELRTDDKMTDDDLLISCFRAAYVLQLLHKGYGFQMNETIRVVDVIEGQKVGWALGAMIYEINTLPWSYEGADNTQQQWVVNDTPMNKSNFLSSQWAVMIIVGICCTMFTLVVAMLFTRERKLQKQHNYEEIRDDVLT